MSFLHSNNPHDVVDDHHFSPPIETSDTFWPFLQDNIDSLLVPLQNTCAGIDVSNHPANENSAVISNTSIDERPENIFTNMIGDILDNSPDNHYLLYHHGVSDDQTLLDDQMKVSDDPLLTSVMQEAAAILEPLAVCNEGMNSSAVLGEQNSLMLVESGKDELRKEDRMGKGKIKRRLARTLLKGSKAEGSTSKKEEHNAKEKVRRMKLNASYLALGSLLPHSRRSKKRRWSAPVVIDKVLEYIPQLETEIEELKLKKYNLLYKAETKQPMQRNYENAEQTSSAPTISMHHVKQGEVIVQFCLPKEQKKNLSDMLLNIETESMNIESASSIDVCEDSICYHLHLKLNEDQEGSDNLALLKERISCLLN